MVLPITKKEAGSIFLAEEKNAENISSPRFPIVASSGFAEMAGYFLGLRFLSKLLPVNKGERLVLVPEDPWFKEKLRGLSLTGFA